MPIGKIFHNTLSDGSNLLLYQTKSGTFKLKLSGDNELHVQMSLHV